METLRIIVVEVLVMANFKNITIKKKGGGTRTQRVKVLASGKYKFVKNIKKSRSSNPRPKKKARKVRSVAKRKRRRQGFSIPLAPIAGLACGLLTNSQGWSPVEFALAGNWQFAVAALAQNYLGFDPISGKIDLLMMKNGTLPLVLGLMIHKFVGGRPLNANAMLARAGVPLIRI